MTMNPAFTNIVPIFMEGYPLTPAFLANLQRELEAATRRSVIFLTTPSRLKFTKKGHTLNFVITSPVPARYLNMTTWIAPVRLPELPAIEVWFLICLIDQVRIQPRPRVNRPSKSMQQQWYANHIANIHAGLPMRAPAQQGPQDMRPHPGNALQLNPNPNAGANADLNQLLQNTLVNQQANQHQPLANPNNNMQPLMNDPNNNMQLNNMINDNNIDAHLNVAHYDVGLSNGEQAAHEDMQEEDKGPAADTASS